MRAEKWTHPLLERTERTRGLQGAEARKDEAFRSLGCPAHLWDFARPLFVLGWDARGADLIGSLVKTVPIGELHRSLRLAIDGRPS